jgi:membrane protein
MQAKQSRWWLCLKESRERWTEVEGDQRSAALAYYLLLALLPVVIMLVNAGSLFVDREVATRAVVQLANRYTPLTAVQEQAAEGAIRGVLAARGAISLAAFGLLIVSSLQFLRALIRTTNRVWRLKPYDWWRLPLKSLGLLGTTASAVLVGILLPGAARLVQQRLTSAFALPDWTFALVFTLIPWLALFYGVIMLYRLAPSRATTFAEVWFGALVATVMIWSGEFLFLMYAAHVVHFNVLYGTVGGVVAFLLWVYLSSGVGVLGVCWCAAQAAVRQAGRQGDPPGA